MSTYVMFTKLTEEGRKRKRTGESSKEINKEPNKRVEELGVKILAQYALLGPYDFVNILEAPSKEVIMRVAMEINSMGMVTTLTMAAIPISDLRNALKK